MPGRCLCRALFICPGEVTIVFRDDKLRERVAVLENQVKDLQDQVKTFMERQDILMSNDVALKQDLEELKKPKEPKYFG
jgi:regulator of replication initiation timing